MIGGTVSLPPAAGEAESTQEQDHKDDDDDRGGAHGASRLDGRQTADRMAVWRRRLTRRPRLPRFNAMSPRARSLSGIVLLFATSLALAEGVFAATCGSGMEQDSPAMADMLGMGEAADDDMASMPRDHDCPPGDDHHPSHEGRGGAPCPFALPGMAQGCSAPASLPAPTIAPLSSQAEVKGMGGTVSTSAPSSTAVSIFHPPKA